MSIRPGARLSDVEVEALIGRGATSHVYRGYQRSLQRPVAIKVLAGAETVNEELLRRFQREAVNLARLEHEAIVPLYQVVGEGADLCLVMRLVRGRSLKEVLAERGPLPAEEALPILDRIARALDYAHRAGVVHRDIKPSNILIDERGLAYLSDFGLSRSAEQGTVTASGQWQGTPAYVAPEQAAGDAEDPRSDLYSFGCVAFECLTGTPPYTAQDLVALLLAHAGAPVPSAADRNPRLGREVDRVFGRALAKTPRDRCPDATTMVSDLGQALGRPGRRGLGRPRWPRWSRTRRTIAAGAGAALALAAVAGSLLGIHQAETPRRPVASPSALAGAQPRPAVPVGRMFYRAPLDGTSDGFVLDQPSSGGYPQFQPGQLVLNVTQPNGGSVTVDMNASLTKFVGAYDLAVKPGSNVVFDTGLRWAIAHQLAYLLEVDTQDQTVWLEVWNAPNDIPITPRVRVPGLRTGRVVHLVVVVDDPHLTLYVDGRRVADATDTQVPMPKGTEPEVDAWSNSGGTGAVRILGIRFYALPGPAPAPTASARATAA
jgi:tRNA A-37 threonylcarbamoyl transferase component Bud32